MNESNSKPKLLEALGANPVLVLLLGACPAMAVTTDVRAALTIGVAAIIVMALSSLAMAALKSFISARATIAVGIIVNTFFASAVELLMYAYLPHVYSMMGVYVAICAVNLLIFANSENAVRDNLSRALCDSFLSGLYFTVVILAVAAIRELFGCGTFAGSTIAFFKAHTVSVLAQPAGGFLIYAFVAAIVNKLYPTDLTGARGYAFAATGVAELAEEAEAAAKEDEE